MPLSDNMGHGRLILENAPEGVGIMKITVLGTGMVGDAIATRLIKLGHEVRMGSRTNQNPNAEAWVKRCGHLASQGDFANSATFGEMVFNCTNGATAIEALTAAGASNLAGKILVDVSNALDISMQPPGLLYGRNTSLGERLQAAFPKVRVVKTLNTVNCKVMVAPRQIPGAHNIFVSGNDPGAKTSVSEFLCSFGWEKAEIIDLGDITTARGPEMFLPLWLRLYGALGTGAFNIKVVR
jgi:8-hydroxy-5-deazaflavin:NADPH oxidoreductase